MFSLNTRKHTQDVENSKNYVEKWDKKTAKLYHNPCQGTSYHCQIVMKFLISTGWWDRAKIKVKK